MLDKLRQIAIFAKTVEHGSFRAAAHALELSPSVVSHHVNQLESSIGTALLYRSTRKLSLTPDGERLLESAQAMIEAAELGLQAMSNQTKQYSGILRVTIPAIFAQSLLTDRLAEFAIKHPKVELSLDLTEVRRDLIADGFDMAIRAGKLKDSALKAQKLTQLNRRLVASPKYLEQQPKPESPVDLRDWDWVGLSPVRHLETVFRHADERQTIKNYNSRIYANNAQALAQLARAGVGLAIIPEFLAEPHIAAKELQYMLPKWTLEPIDVFAVWPSNAPKDGLTKLLVNFLKTAQLSQ